MNIIKQLREQPTWLQDGPASIATEVCAIEKETLDALLDVVEAAADLVDAENRGIARPEDSTRIAIALERLEDK